MQALDSSEFRAFPCVFRFIINSVITWREEPALSHEDRTGSVFTYNRSDLIDYFLSPPYWTTQYLTTSFGHRLNTNNTVPNINKPQIDPSKHETQLFGGSRKSTNDGYHPSRTVVHRRSNPHNMNLFVFIRPCVRRKEKVEAQTKHANMPVPVSLSVLQLDGVVPLPKPGQRLSLQTVSSASSAQRQIIVLTYSPPDF